MTHIKQVLINTLSGWVAFVARACIALVLVPFLVRQLGREGFGLIGLAAVILSLSQVADMGLRQALGREMAEDIARDDIPSLSRLASSALLLYVMLAGFIALIGYFLAPWLVEVLKVSPSLKGDGLFIVRVYGCSSLIISFLTPVFSAGLVGSNRFDIVNGIQVAGAIISGLVMFIVLPQLENGLYGWVGIMLLMQVIILIMTANLFFRFFPGVRFGFRKFSLSRLKPLFVLSGSMYLLQLSRALTERSNPLVISYFFGPTGVALYTPGGKLSEMLRPIVLTLGNQLYPLTTRHHAQGDNRKLGMVLVTGSKITMLLGALACVAMIAVAEPFCRLWLYDSFGSDYQVVVKIMQGWAVATFFIYMGGTQWSILLGMKRLRFLVALMLPTALFSVLASVYLLGWTSVGIPGVLLATIFIEAVRRPILFVYCTKILGLPLLPSIRATYSRPVLITFLLFLLSAGLQICWNIDSWFDLCALLGVMGIFWAAMVWLVGMTPEEKRLIFEGLLKHKK